MTLVYRFQDRTTLLERLGNSAVKLIKTLATRGRVQRERRLLAMLDDRLLRDIGISRADAELEASRASWDVPSERLPDTNAGKTHSRAQHNTGSCCSDNV